MKKLFSIALFVICVQADAQIGIGTTTPNSTLDVRGSLSTGVRTFTATTTAAITDNILIFTGTAATTLTLPTAVGITGRNYQIKNASLTGPTPALTIATTSSQTIDGLANWTLNGLYQTVTLTSNGSNWYIVNDLPSSSAISWSQTGNSNINPSINFLGTSDDRQMILKSNGQSYLEFGRRQTLGLTQGFTDYNDNDEKVTYIRSALQFEAANAAFYKPKMYADGNGNFRVKGSSAGTDYFEFGSTGTNNDGGFEFIIGDDGDEPILFKSYHYLNGMSEIMRLQSGRMAVGSNAFNGTNPEKLLIDAGVTTSYNLMTGKGSIDNYLQINVQNRSTGASASSDLVATSDNGSETVNFIDMGINGGGNTSTGALGGANTAYLYTTGNDFAIGNATAAKSINFFTGGTATTNERMRIDGSGNVGIGINNPAYKLHVLAASNPLYLLGVQTGASTDSFLTITNGVVKKLHSSALASSSWALNGNSVSSVQNIGTITNYALPFITNNIERMRIDATGNVGIGTNAPSSKFEVSGTGGAIVSKLTTTANTDRSVLQVLNSAANGGTIDLRAHGATYTETLFGSSMSGASSLIAFPGAGAPLIMGTFNATDIIIGTSNAERMRIKNTGTVGIGTSTFSGTNPEKLIIDAGATGNTNYQNVIVGKGNTNSYAQLNIQNINAGNGASSDVVATADNGSETNNYVDMGINSSTNNSGVMGAANDAYLYNLGQNFLIGSGTAAKSLVFMTGGTTQATNERMRIDGTGKVGIGNNSPTSTVHITGSVAMSVTTKTAAYTATASDYTIICNNTSGSINITLPAASGCAGRIYIIKKVSGVFNNVVVDPNGAETIDGAGTRTLTTQYESIMIQSDGTNWYVL